MPPLYLSVKRKFQVDSKRKDMEWSTNFSENIINLTCMIIKMLASRVDKFSAGRTKCRSPTSITLGLALLTTSLVKSINSDSLKSSEPEICALL